MSDRASAVPVLVGWTVLLWMSRVRNVFAADDLSGAGRALRVGAAAVFVALAVWVIVARRSRSGRVGSDRLAVRLLVIWTVGFWAVRGTGIIIDDHPIGFTVIHTLLMVVSIGLAAWAWTVAGRIPATTPVG